MKKGARVQIRTITVGEHGVITVQNQRGKVLSVNGAYYTVQADDGYLYDGEIMNRDEDGAYITR